MKRVLALVGVVSVLTACGSNPNLAQQEEYTKRVQVAQERADKFADRQIEQAPTWMSKLPKSEGAVYENGTAVSSDFGMADMKARTIAYAKICTAAGGKVRSQTKIYRNDGDMSSTEASEMSIRSICPDIDISGVETVEMKHISEGGRIRTYVLVALPIGKSNVIVTNKQIQQEQSNSRARAPEAFKELDNIVDPKPQSKVTDPADLKLVEVNNAEYKAKRDEALQKPGAVVGHAALN